MFSFPQLIKLVGKHDCDLKYNLENILNPHACKKNSLVINPLVNNITEIEEGVFIVSFHYVSGVLNSLYKNLYKETEARLVISNTMYYTISFINESLQFGRPRQWLIEPPFQSIEYGLLYKGRSYINWIVEHTESMEIDYILY